MVGLGDLPGGGSGSVVSGVSADGSVVVGSGNSASGSEAFRWTQAGGMVGLGDLPGGGFISQAYGVSADGSVVVGIGNSTSGGEAFIWDEANGMKSLESILIAQSVGGIEGWSLRHAYDISADGRTIVGYGINPSGDTEAFIATIPEPNTALLLGVGLASLAVRREKR